MTFEKDGDESAMNTSVSVRIRKEGAKKKDDDVVWTCANIRQLKKLAKDGSMVEDALREQAVEAVRERLDVDDKENGEQMQFSADLFSCDDF